MSFRRLKDGSRATLIGIVRDLRIIPYAGGSKNRMQFDFEDQTGVIVAVAWDDAYENFDFLEENETYKITSAKIQTNSQQQGRLEIKLYDNTIVEKHADIKIAHTYTDIDTIQPSKPVHIRAIVADISEYDGQCRFNLLDKTGDITAFLRKTLEPVGINEGDIVEVHGRAANDATDRVFVHTVVKADDPSLVTFWEEKKGSFAPKRQKLADCIHVKKIADIKNHAHGSRCEVRGIVRSCSIKPTPLENKGDSKGERVKYNMSIVDDSLAAISVGVFCDKTVPFDVKIGSAVLLQASVSSYWGCSLTCNSVATIDDMDLETWWKSGHAATAAFDELSQPNSS